MQPANLLVGAVRLPEFRDSGAHAQTRPDAQRAIAWGDRRSSLQRTAKPPSSTGWVMTERRDSRGSRRISASQNNDVFISINLWVVRSTTKPSTRRAVRRLPSSSIAVQIVSLLCIEITGSVALATDTHQRAALY